MPTLTPPTDSPLHGIIEHDGVGFTIQSEVVTASPFPFCEQGAIASVRAHAAYLRSVAKLMEDFATELGFDTTEWIELPEDEPTQDVGINEALPAYGTWDWAKIQMKQGMRVTRPVPGVDWHYFMDASGKIMFGVPDDENSDPDEAEISTHDTSSVAWRIYEGTT